MVISKIWKLFGFVVLLSVCSSRAVGQTCNTDPWPKDDSILTFSIWPGEYLPRGAHCYCDGVPRVSADCYTPKHSKTLPDSRCPFCGSPISLATGNTFIGQTDIKIPGLGNGLTLVRTWNSVLRSSLLSVGLFGPNWRSTYEEQIYVDSDSTVAYERGDGSVWNFAYSGGRTYTSIAPTNAVATLVDGPTNWTLTFQNGEQRTFDIVSGNLTSIADRNRNTTQLSYDASFRLVTVTDAASRHLYFSYANPSSYLVTGVSSDVGLSLSYFYDNMGRLARYTKPDNTTVSFNYQDTNNPTLITAVLDLEGKVLESHTYDAQGRGLTSSRAGGIEALTVTYPPPAQGLP